MEITVKGKCPACEERMTIYVDTDKTIAETEKKQDEVKEMRERFFNLTKFSLNEDNKEPLLFKDLRNFIEESKIEPKISDILQSHFYYLECKINLMKSVKILQKAEKEVAKSKIVVSKKTKKEFETNKKRILNMIKKKIEKLKK